MNETEEQLAQSVAEYHSKTDPWGFWVSPLKEANDLYIEGELRDLAERIWARWVGTRYSLPMALAFVDDNGHRARACIREARFIMEMATEMGWRS